MIINFTPTGMIPTKDMTQHVPVTVEEIISDICKYASIGVNMVHIHARDDGKPTYKKEIYAKIIEGIRNEHPELIICVSLSGRDFSEFEQRSDPINLTGDLKPDMGSLTLSSLNFSNQESMNSPKMIKDLASKMLDNGVKPELEVFDIGMLNFANYLINKDLIKPPFYFNIILGNIASAQADLTQLGTIINDLPSQSVWCAGGIGKAQLKSNILGMLFGHGVRIGLEDNIWWNDDRTELASNGRLIGRVLSVADMIGKKPYSHDSVRKILGI